MYVFNPKKLAPERLLRQNLDEITNMKEYINERRTVQALKTTSYASLSN